MFTFRELGELGQGDFAFEVEADSFSTLLSGAGTATTSAMIDLETLEPSQSVSFEVSEENNEALLFEFLDEILYQKDAKYMLFKTFDVEILSQDGMKQAKCVASGEKINPEKHVLKTDVKAITMHELVVEQRDEHTWYCQVIIDL